MKFTSGCRIHFSMLSPNGAPVIDDVLEARIAHIDDGVLRICDSAGNCIRYVNFSQVLVVQPLETVGPGARTNA